MERASEELLQGFHNDNRDSDSGGSDGDDGKVSDDYNSDATDFGNIDIDADIDDNNSYSKSNTRHSKEDGTVTLGREKR
jgi:hypothetical protein